MRTDRAAAWPWVLGLFLLLCGACPASASGPEHIDARVPPDNGIVKALVFRAPGNAPRPAVLILHGRQGLDAFKEAYSRVAETLAAQGLDAYVLSYYGPGEARDMNSQDKAGRADVFARRAALWAMRVSAVAREVLAGPRSNGRIGIMGFSQGGYLGVACAARDERFGALVVMYGGIPGLLAGDIRRLPPLLAFHGQADAVVPFSEGACLVQTAKRLGGFAELVGYPGEGHGFKTAAAQEARGRAAAFLRQRLLTPEF